MSRPINDRSFSRLRRSLRGLVLTQMLLVALPVGAQPAAAPTVASGHPSSQRLSAQALYLPVYSNVWHGERDRSGKPQKTLLSVLVSIRNPDPVESIRLLSARYHDTSGRLVREYLPVPQTIAPLATAELFVGRADDSGGSGASFLIRWTSERPANPPVVEALHLDTPAGRPIVFTTQARPLAQP